MEEQAIVAFIIFVVIIFVIMFFLAYGVNAFLLVHVF